MTIAITTSFSAFLIKERALLMINMSMV
jgi:hypothetical protein